MGLNFYRRREFLLCKRWAPRGKFLVFCILSVPLTYMFISICQHHLSEKNFLPRSTTRGKCCEPDGLKNICAQMNCHKPCLNSRRSTPELDNLLKKSMHYGENAFFIETSGIGTLNIRQSCAVESLALHNPKLIIRVLFMTGFPNTNVDPVGKLKDKYNNIQFANINLDEYVAGSPLENWYYCNNSWRNGPFNISHLSDGLRFLTLFKYGGYYFDLDVISVRSVTGFRNFVVAEDDDYLGSSVIHAELRNPVIHLAIEDFVSNYRPDIGGHNGPALLLRVMQNWCKVPNLQSMNDASCRGFGVLHYSFFYPVHCSDAEALFRHRFSNEAKFKTTNPPWVTKEVFGVHTWNQLTHNKPVYKNSTQYYRWLAEANCPITFAMAPKVF